MTISKDGAGSHSKATSVSSEAGQANISQARHPSQGHKEKALPELKNVRGGVVMRFAPNPSGPLHIGHVRAAVLNDEYVRRYGGRFILRLEDTDPKRVDPNAYSMIPEDLRWLGVAVHDTFIQSDRLSVYRDIAARMISEGHAYLCSCKPEDTRELRKQATPCECRSLQLSENLKRWEEMKKGKHYAVILRTDIKDKNPALRDPAIMRVVNEEHPRIGRITDSPLYNFSVAVDDHFMGVTHILRGKDHLINTEIQKIIYGFLGWKTPEFIHYGLLRIEETVLSKSGMSRGIKEGEFTGWDDIRLGTLAALKRRGIRPEAVRAAVLNTGCTQVDSTFEWANLYSENKKLIEPIADRYYFVPSPLEVWVREVPHIETVKVPFHKDFPERGFREIRVPSGDIRLFIPKHDSNLKKGEEIRFMNLGNARVIEEDPLTFLYLKEKNLKVNKLQWLPADATYGCEVLTPTEKVAGFCEKNCAGLREGAIIQFERFGFVRVDRNDNGLVCYWAHG